MTSCTHDALKRRAPSAGVIVRFSHRLIALDHLLALLSILIAPPFLKRRRYGRRHPGSALGDVNRLRLKLALGVHRHPDSYRAVADLLALALPRQAVWA